MTFLGRLSRDKQVIFPSPLPVGDEFLTFFAFTINEARDFAGFRKWRRRRCWMLELQTNFFHNLDPICVCFLVGYICKHLFL